VFVGGLILLLVGVASLSPQEQKVPADYFLMGFGAIVFSLCYENNFFDWKESFISPIGLLYLDIN